MRGGLDLLDPVARLVLLTDPVGSLPDRIIALAGGAHQDILASLEDQQAKTMVAAYQSAREQLGSRLNEIYDKTFGAGATPEPKDLIEFARGEELLGSIDSHLDALGITTQALQGQAFSAGAALGIQQANVELGMVTEDFGLPHSIFGNLNTLVPDLGMAAAVNETKNLSDTLRSEVHSELTQGAVLGEGINKIQARVDGVLEGAKVGGQSRAELISRWATIKGYNAAADQALNDAAEVIDGLQEMWIVDADENTCGDCMAHYGETTGPGDEFDSSRSFNNTPISVYGGFLEYPPLHPRCRCTITAWHPRWEGIATLGPAQLQEDAQKLAQSNGFAPKSFEPATKPTPGSLRATRAGREVLRAQNIAVIPEGVRKATMEKFLKCWGGA